MNNQEGSDLIAVKCTTSKLGFQDLEVRDFVGRFDGGAITLDPGNVFLCEAENRARRLCQLSECFLARRDSDRSEHSVEASIMRWVLSRRLGNEDFKATSIFSLTCHPTTSKYIDKKEAITPGEI